MIAKGPARDVGKETRWRKLIGDAARSGLSIRAFCQQRRVDEGQFYAWRRELKLRDERKNGTRDGMRARRGTGPTFALVSTEGEGELAGIELVLAGGERLRISRGVDAETLRTVVGALGEPSEC